MTTVLVVCSSTWVVLLTTLLSSEIHHGDLLLSITVPRATVSLLESSSMLSLTDSPSLGVFCFLEKFWSFIGSLFGISVEGFMNFCLILVDKKNQLKEK